MSGFNTVCNDARNLYRNMMCYVNASTISKADIALLEEHIGICSAKVEEIMGSYQSGDADGFDNDQSESDDLRSESDHDQYIAKENFSGKRALEEVDASTSITFSMKLPRADAKSNDISIDVTQVNAVSGSSSSHSSGNQMKDPNIDEDSDNGNQRNSLVPLNLPFCESAMVQITHLERFVYGRSIDLRYMALVTMFDLDFEVISSLYGYNAEHCEKVYNALMSAHVWSNDQLLFLRQKLEFWHKRRDNRVNIDWSDVTMNCAGKSEEDVQEFCRIYGSIVRSIGFRGEKSPELLHYLETGE